MAVPGVHNQAPAAAGQQNKAAAIEHRTAPPDETPEERSKRIKERMAAGAKTHGTCDRTKRVWEGRLDMAARCEYTRDSKIRDDLKNMLEKMDYLDRECLDIEKVYQGSGDIDEIDLDMVKEYNEVIEAMVKTGRDTMTTLIKMIDLEKPKPKADPPRRL